MEYSKWEIGNKVNEAGRVQGKMTQQGRNLQLLDGGEGILIDAYKARTDLHLKNIQEIMSEAYLNYIDVVWDKIRNLTPQEYNPFYRYKTPQGQSLKPGYVIGTLLNKMKNLEPKEALKMVQDICVVPNGREVLYELYVPFDLKDPLELDMRNAILTTLAVLLGGSPSVQNIEQFKEITDQLFDDDFISKFIVAAKIDLTKYFEEIGKIRSVTEGPNGERYVDYYANKPVIKEPVRNNDKPPEKPVENKPIEKKDELVPLVKKEDNKKPGEEKSSMSMYKKIGLGVVGVGFGGLLAKKIYDNREEIGDKITKFFSNKPEGDEQQELQQIPVIKALSSEINLTQSNNSQQLYDDELQMVENNSQSNSENFSYNSTKSNDANRQMRNQQQQNSNSFKLNDEYRQMVENNSQSNSENFSYNSTKSNDANRQMRNQQQQNSNSFKLYDDELQMVENNSQSNSENFSYNSTKSNDANRQKRGDGQQSQSNYIDPYNSMQKPQEQQSWQAKGEMHLNTLKQRQKLSQGKSLQP